MLLTTAPHLHVRRPSPTTAEFTVTTCPPLTLSVRLLLGLVFVLRVLLGFSALLLLHSSWTIPQYQHQHQHQHQHQLQLQHDASYYGGGGSGGSGSIVTGPPYFLPNATAIIHGGGGATAASAALVHGQHSRPQQHDHPDYEHDDADMPTPPPPSSSSSLRENEHAVAALAPAAAPTEPIEMLPRPDTLYTTAWAAYLLQQIHASSPGHLIATLAQTLPPSLVFPLCLLLLYLTTQRIHTTESLLVLRGLGIQTSSTGGNYLHWPLGGGGGRGGGENGKTRFIPTEKIRDVLINEAFRGFGVRYYLVVVVDGEEDVVVVFPGLLPRRAIVEKVWRGVRGCLWEPQDGLAIGGGGGGGGGGHSSHHHHQHDVSRRTAEENKASSSG